MAFVKNKNKIKLGGWVYTAKKVESLVGYFEKGTKVQIVGMYKKNNFGGYDLEDEHGNQILECSCDCIENN